MCPFLRVQHRECRSTMPGHDPVEDGSPPAFSCLRRRARPGISHFQFPVSRLGFLGGFDPRGLERDSAICVPPGMGARRCFLRAQRSLVL